MQAQLLSSHTVRATHHLADLIRKPPAEPHAAACHGIPGCSEDQRGAHNSSPLTPVAGVSKVVADNPGLAFGLEFGSASRDGLGRICSSRRPA